MDRHLIAIMLAVFVISGNQVIVDLEEMYSTNTAGITFMVVKNETEGLTSYIICHATLEKESTCQIIYREVATP